MHPERYTVSRKAPTELMESDIPKDQWIDVRSPDAHQACAIGGSSGICVYEVAFLDQVAKQFPDTATPLIVYGQSDKYYAADLAANRLTEAGYTRIHLLEGGIEAWYAAEGVITAASTDPKPILDRHLRIDLKQSKARWIGRNLLNQHNGRVAPVFGEAGVHEDGTLASGSVVMDMRSIQCEDIEDPSMQQALIQHLSHADFFLTDQHPQATFDITSVVKNDHQTTGHPGYEVTGNINVRGITRKITVPALWEAVDGGYSFQTQFDLNRTEHGSFYGSGKFFEKLGMHLVNDLVSIHLSFVFK